MIYRPFGKLNWNVSCVAMGTWNIGNQWGEVDEKTAVDAITTALDGGVNLFDTAEGYGIPNGLSEERLAKALGTRRNKVFIASKIGMYGRSTGFPTRTDNALSIRNSAHASLHRLQRDHHDILFCHEPNPEHPDAYLEAFEMLKKEGRLRLSGVSTDQLDVIKKFNENGQCDVVEIDYSILQRDHEKELIPYCQKHNIGILVRRALQSGLLSGKYNKNSVFGDVRTRWNPGGKNRTRFEAQIDAVDRLKTKFGSGESLISTALRYVASNPAAPVALFGAKDPAQVLMNLNAGSRLLTNEEIQTIRKLILATQTYR